MGLKLNTASSGSVSLEPANTASNYTLTVPAQDGTVVAADSSGNVGIGTSSPEFQLHVSGANPRLQLTDTDTGADSYVSASSSNGSLILGADENNEVASSVMTFRVDGSDQARITSAGLMQFNSGYGSLATAYGCRAWVNFNGTGTVAIRASGNVSSITDNGTGDYRVNFTTAMPDANYATNVTGSAPSNSNTPASGVSTSTAPTSSAVRITFNVAGVGQFDTLYTNVSIFR